MLILPLLVLITACQARQPAVTATAKAPAASATPASVYFPKDQVTVPTPGRPYNQAELEGQVAVVYGCLGIIATDGQPYIVVWPPEFRLIQIGEQWQLRDSASNSLLAKIGDIVALSGGYYRSAHAQSIAKDTLPATCVEPFQDRDAFFLAGPWLEVFQPAQSEETAIPTVMPTPAEEIIASPAAPSAPESILLYSMQTLNPAAPTLPTWGLQAAPLVTSFDNPVFAAIYGNLGTGENYPGYFINFRPRQSPDGRYVLIPGIGGYNPPEVPGTGLWLADLQEETVRQLLPTVPIAVWSPHSDAIAYLVDNTIYVRNLDGNETPNALFTHDELAAPFLAWSPDGQWLAVITAHQGDVDPKTNYPTLTQTLWLIASETGTERELVSRPFMAIEHANNELSWTSDSQHLLLQDQVINLAGEQVTIGSVLSANGVQPLSAQSAMVANRAEGLQLFTPDGMLITAITTTPVTTWAVSPDGQRLAYALDSSTTTALGIGIFDLITQQLVTTLALPDGIDQVRILRWNATGDLLYFDDWGYNSPIWAAPAASTNEAAMVESAVVVEDGLLVEVLVKAGIDQPIPADTAALAGRELERWSSASPDGAWVAEGLAAFPKAGDNIYYTELRVKKADGSVEWIPVALWSRFGLGYTTPRPLRWSPDGRYLYFTNAPVPDGCGLFMNAADLQRLELADGTVQEVLPFGATWSLAIAPDAQRAVYSNGDTLYLLDLVTANYASIKVEELEAGAQWGNFVWSPDGQQIAFTIAYQPCLPPSWSHSLLLLDTQTLTVTTVLEKDPRRLTITEWVDAGNLALSAYDNKQWLLDLATGTIK